MAILLGYSNQNQARLKAEKNTLQKEYQKWQSLPEKIGQYAHVHELALVSF
jgi:hypothetical protein